MDIDEGECDDMVMAPDSSPHLSPTTLIYYQKMFRDLVADTLLETAGGYMVGGPGQTIEIDESLFGG